MAIGKMVTTNTMRSECANATRSVAAPYRSPRLAISAAPPGMQLKKAVARSAPDRRASSHALKVPKASAASPSATNQGQSEITCCTTGPVKYSPSETPTTTNAASRPPGSGSKRAPASCAEAIAKVAPIIQGSGVPIAAQAAPPIALTARPPAMGATLVLISNGECGSGWGEQL
jgi:hypothetical protein